MGSLLSQIAFIRTYAALKPDGTKETWGEVCDRYENHLIKHYPSEENKIKWCVGFIRRKQVVPSMRLLQFAGGAVEKKQLRGYNCAFVNITSVRDLCDILYLSSCGVGCGFSVQRRHIEQLPVIEDDGGPVPAKIADTRESWANSIKALFYFPSVVFDYSDIRPAGAPLSTGGAASGPEPLRECHERIRKVLKGAIGRKLRPIEVHSIACSIGHAIVSGGVRRSAMISLFDKDDAEMLAAKQGEWWVENPHFARANNSAVLVREQTSRAEFDSIMDACFASGSGEPGCLWTNNPDWGTNPCAEIALRSRQLCNLTEVVLPNCLHEGEFISAVEAATTLGTYQAGFTDFGYVHEDWAKNCAEEALLGVSLTGQAQNWNLLAPARLRRAAKLMKLVNAAVAKRIGIKPAARIGTTKPSGTTSSVLDCSSGIHAVHAPFYYRRVRVSKLDPLASYLQNALPPVFIEHNAYEPNDIIVGVPMRMPGISRNAETATDLLSRMKRISTHWIRPSHRSGDNTHNVSLTVSFKHNECKRIKNWMWKNQSFYNGISLLPFSDSTYDFAPYEEISEEEYHRLSALMPDLDLSKVKFREDTRDATAACEGQLCEIPRR